jgi:hypothetical protein
MQALYEIEGAVKQMEAERDNLVREIDRLRSQLESREVERPKSENDLYWGHRVVLETLRKHLPGEIEAYLVQHEPEGLRGERGDDPEFMIDEVRSQFLLAEYAESMTEQRICRRLRI